MNRTYTKLDANNIAVVETQESRTIINKETLLNQKAEITEKFNKNIADLDEALAEF